MTKVLVITNKSDITSDFIIKELRDREIDFYRFNTEELSKSCQISINVLQGKCILYDSILEKKIDLSRFTSVYFRRPEIPEIDIDNLTTGEHLFVKNEYIFLLEGIYKLLRNAYWVSPLYSIRESENKIYQQQIAKQIGFNLPDSIVTNCFSDLVDFCKKNEESSVIKPLKSGHIDDKIDPQIVFTNILKELPKSQEQVKLCPNYLQKHIKKKFDVRVTVVGDSTFSVLIHSQDSSETQTDWRRGSKSLKHSKIELPNHIHNKCVEMVRYLNLRFGAIDLVQDSNGEYFFLEINPNGQWAWIEMKTGHQISKEIVNLLEYEYF